MHINYLEDDDLAFLPECSEAHLEAFTRILTHGENGKPRLSSTLLRNETFLAMEGHPERYRRNWQLIAGEHSILAAIASPTRYAAMANFIARSCWMYVND